MRKLIVAAAFLFTLHAPGIACPVENLDPTTVRDRIDAAPCQRGLKIFQECALGSTPDAFTSEHVIETCEAVFARRLTASERRSYNRAKCVCTRLYSRDPREWGTESISRLAICNAEAAARTATLFSPMRTAKPAM
jgi:hypothetical protein